MRVSMGTSNGFVRVERDGWFIDIETVDVSARPNWEIRCHIRRTKDDRVEERGHRFVVSPELSETYRLAELSEDQRRKLMSQAAKRVILRELDEIFDEPEEGLDSVRPLTASDLS